jgi:glutathione S-transferase
VIMMIKDFDYSPYPNVSAYIQRLRDRPAFQASMTLK